MLGEKSCDMGGGARDRGSEFSEETKPLAASGSVRADETEMRGIVVEATELDWTEINDVRVEGDRLDADNLSRQGFANVDVAGLAFDLAGGPYGAELYVGRVLELGQ